MEKNEQVIAKLFLGVLMTSEIKMHLRQSSIWKNSTVISDQSNLLEVSHDKKKYIGAYLPEKSIHLVDLKEKEQIIMAKLKEYAPGLALDRQTCVVFSQLFVR